MDKGLDAITKLDSCSPALVKDLARAVISTLSHNLPEGLDRRSHVGARMLVGAVTAQHGFDHFLMRERLNNLHLSDEQILDQCIPLAAAQLGVAWEQDLCSFAQVSLGASRLYGFCKDLDIGAPLGGERQDDIPDLIVTFAPEQHLIGPAVLAQQLRRHGCAPSILSNTNADELLQKLLSCVFSAVMVSVGSRVSFRNSRKAISVLRSQHADCPPIIMGGAILGRAGLDRDESGADLMTNNLEDVLQHIQNYNQSGIEAVIP